VIKLGVPSTASIANQILTIGDPITEGCNVE
jgi:hypothetical protein